MEAEIRVDLPSNEIDDIPDYDRGYVDQFRLVDARRLFDFLEREAFASKWTPIGLQPPIFNSPEHISQEPVDTEEGYFRGKGNVLIPFEIMATSTTSWPRRVTLELTLRPKRESSNEPVSFQEAEALFKPEFLKLLKQVPQYSRAYSGLVLQEQGTQQEWVIHIEAPLEFSFETEHLSDLRVQGQ